MPAGDAQTIRLFSYGTLRQREVQLAVFGRELVEQPDTLTGFVLGRVAIDDDGVVGISGAAVHPVLYPTDDPASEIVGAALLITAEELHRADLYETDAYRRIAVTLKSGVAAFVYVAAD